MQALAAQQAPVAEGVPVIDLALLEAGPEAADALARQVDEARPVVETLLDVLATAQAAHPRALNSLRELVAVSQIIFGTDYPYRTAKETAKGIAGCGFSAGQIKAIDRRNALGLFPRLSG